MYVDYSNLTGLDLKVLNIMRHITPAVQELCFGGSYHTVFVNISMYIGRNEYDTFFDLYTATVLYMKLV